MSDERDALFVTHGGPMLDPIIPLLRRSNFTVHRTGAEPSFLETVTSSPFQLIVVEDPVEGVPIETVIAAVRAPDSASKSAGLMVVVDDARAGEMEHLVGKGINRLVRRSHVGAEFLMAMADLMAVEPRRPLRAVLRVQVTATSTAQTILAQTENLSASGMLVRGSTRHFPVGSEIDFQLALPGSQEPVRGRAQVVRHAQWRRERIEGFGVRFTNLGPSGAERLKDALTNTD